MLVSFFASRSRFFSWLKQRLSFRTAPACRQPVRRRPALLLEPLEDRLTPASIGDNLGTLTIVLDSPGELLTVKATGSNQYQLTSTAGLFNAGLTGAGLSGETLTVTGDSSIRIVDASTGAAVTFNDSAGNSFAQAVAVNLTNILSGDIDFNGTSTFAAGLSVSTVNGDISSSAGSTINLPSGNLNVRTNHNIDLAGTVNVVTGSSVLRADGTITANNSNNVFGGGLDLLGNTGASTTAATISAAGALLLDQAAIAGDITVNAGGDITQNSALTVTGNGSFTSSGGNVTLSNSSNTIGGDFAASAAGSNNITLYSSGNITLGVVSLATGNLTLQPDGSVGAISEEPAGGITMTSGTININAFGPQNPIDLSGAANDLPAAVSLFINGISSFSLSNVSLRNTDSGASASQLHVHDLNVGNLTLIFDNAASVDVAKLPSFLGTLSVTAKGNIIQSSPFPSLIGASFTSTDGDIVLDGGGGLNMIFGAVSASVTGSHNITIEDFFPEFSLGTLTLGSGTLTLTDDAEFGFSSFTEVSGGSITTAGAVNLDIAKDANVKVTLDGANDLKAGATLTVNGVAPANGGPTSGDLAFRNTDMNASLSQLAFLNYNVNNLTLAFDNAALNASAIPAATGDVNLTAGGDVTQPNGLTVAGNLSETAGGDITQGDGPAGAISVSGAATFGVTGSASNITLTNEANRIAGTISFNAPAANTGNIAFTNSSNVVLGTSSLGQGSFSITAGGTGIIDASGASITQAAGAGNASFTAGGTSIDLNGVQNFFTGTVIFNHTSASPVTVSLENANPAATLASVSVNGVTNLSALNLVFDGQTASILLPAFSVAYDFSLKETRDIVLLDSPLAVTAGHNLNLESIAGNIKLLGAVNVAGTTSLSADGNGTTSAIIASNAANQFGSQLNISNLGNSSTTIVSAGTLTLGSITVSGPFSATADAVAQASGTSFSSAGAAGFTANTGDINLNGTGNFFAGAVSAAVSGAGNVVLDSAGTTILGTVTLGTGKLIVNSASGIREDEGGGITTAADSTATLTFAVTGASAGVDLSEAPNNFAPGTSVVVAGAPSSGAFGLRNANPAAAMSQVTFTSFTIESLTVQFDNTSINVDNLPAFSNAGNLTLTAGGNITQSANAIVTSGDASFTASGNGAILLSNAGNQISGTVSFANANADNKHDVAFVNDGSIALGNSTLGLGKFSVTTTANGGDPGNISGAGTVSQARGGGAVTFTAAGSSIMLNTGAGNEFSGPVTLAGGGSLTAVAFANDDPLAAIPVITGFAGTFQSFTINLSHAPVLLGNVAADTLNVTAGGNISQAGNSSLQVTGEATFSTGSFSILLPNNNDIQEVALNNSGQNAVTVNTTGALLIDSSRLGTGPVTITTAGAITETDAAGIRQALAAHDQVAGLISLSAGANPILLDSSNNRLIGPIAVATSGVVLAIAGNAGNNVTIVNGRDTILAGANVSGGLTVSALNGSISQAPGTSIDVSGNVYLSGDSGLALSNPGNVVSGGSLVSLQTTFGAASLAVTGALQLAASAVGGTLTVTAGGAIGQLAGTAGPANGVITAQGASFTSTGGNIDLINPANDFQNQGVSLSAAGTVSFTDSDTNGLNLGNVGFVGALTLTASGPISQGLGTALTGAGTVTVNNSSNVAAQAIGVDLSAAGNNITGPASFALSNVGTLTLTNRGDINLTASSTVSSSAVVTLNAGGQVTLPGGIAGTWTLGALNVSASTTTVSGNISTMAGGISFAGQVNFTAPVTLDTSVSYGGNISFAGDVNGAQALTFNLPTNGTLDLGNGTWNQYANNLTVNGTNATFNIAAGATFSMSGGMLDITGMTPADGVPSSDNNINVAGTLQVGGAVVVSDGGNGSIVNLNFQSGSTFLVALGSTPAALTFNGANASDAVNIAAGSTLSGFGGLAPAASTPVLQINGGGGIVGTFSNPQDAAGDVFMGTDIVLPAYSYNMLTVAQSGTAAAAVSGTEPDGDKYTVSVTGGAKVAVIDAATGSNQGLEIVVRNGSAATTLTIATRPDGGDGWTEVQDIAIDGTGTATIVASKTNVAGSITSAGPLAALTLHNLGSALAPATLSAGTAPKVNTSITGNLFSNVTITLGTRLNMLSLAAFTAGAAGPDTITATSFGTIKVNGNAAINTPGDFNANLVDSPTAAAALTSALVKGTLSGNWELAGSVGSVTAAATGGWSLGTPAGPGVVNAGALANAGPLNLGTATDVTVNVTGNIGSLTAVSLDDSAGGFLQANSFGTISITGNGVTHGNLDADITAIGHAVKSAIGTLKVAGNLGAVPPSLSPMVVTVAGSSIGTIAAGGQVNRLNVQAPTSAVSSITVGQWLNSDLSAATVGVWKVIGNLPAQMFGSFSGGSVTLGGSAGVGPTLGSFSTSGDLNNADFTIVNGGVGSFTVGGEMTALSLAVQAAANGHLGNISAAQWSEDQVSARSIGTLKSTARAAALAASAAFNGDFSDSAITAFQPASISTPGISNFFAAGTLSGFGNAYIVANGGIGSFGAGRLVDGYQIATDLNGGNGGIGTLNAGAWSDSDIAAAFLGNVKISGFATPEQATAIVKGDFTGSNVVLGGASAGKGINTMTVAHDLAGDTFNVPFGIASLAVNGTITGNPNATTFALLNPAALAANLLTSSGILGTLTAGQVQGVTLDANQAGNIRVTGNTGLGLNGDLSSSSVNIAGFTGPATARIGLANLSIAGNLDGTSLNVRDSINALSVAQQVLSSQLAAALDTNATVKMLTVGSWTDSQLTANSIGSLSVKGNGAHELAGNITNSRLILLANTAGTALGTLVAAGKVEQTQFQITSGSLTSFQSAYFISSSLLVGYSLADPTDLTDVGNNQQPAGLLPGNWEGTFTLGSFKTTGVLDSRNVPSSAGFQTSDVVAGKLGVLTLSGLNEDSLPESGVTAFGIGFRSHGGSTGTLTIAGISHGRPPLAMGAFHYFGLAG